MTSPEQLISDIASKVTDLTHHVDLQDLAVSRDIQDIQEDVRQLQQLAPIYATVQWVDQRLKPLEKIVYGLVGLTLLSVMAALLSVVVRSGGV